MQARALVILTLAIGLGGASVYFARQMVSAPATEAGPQVAMSTVVVARAPLYFGNRLAAENLKVVEWPADSRPEGSFSTIEELTAKDENGEDRVVLRSIEPNEPILASKVSGFGGRATLSSIIDDDMRAVTIRVNDVNGVAGFVLPGDRVDVMITRTEDRNSGITDVLLQNVKVLGVDQEASEKKDQPVVARAVTMEVTPIQAQKLTLGQTVGTLSLSLRNQLNVAAATTRTVTLADLGLGEGPNNAKDQAAPAAPAAAPVAAAPAPVVVDPRATVRIVRGLEPSEQKVARDGGARYRATTGRAPSAPAIVIPKPDLPAPAPRARPAVLIPSS